MDGLRFYSRSRLFAPKADSLVEIAARTGFGKVLLLKPYTIEAASNPQGRIFAVLVKTSFPARSSNAALPRGSFSGKLH